MRTRLLLSLAVTIFVGGVVPARAQDDLKAVIAKAVKAHGGVEKLKALQNKGFEVRSKGTIHLLGGINYTSEAFAQLPDKFKEELQMDINGMQITQIVVLNGDQCWIKAAGMDVKLGDELKKEIKEQMHERKVQGLFPLLSDKGYELAPLGEVKVENEDAVGVKVSAKDHRDVALYFSKKTGLLIKSEGRAFDFMIGQEVAQEMIFDDYKEQDGHLSPRRLTMIREGKKFLEKEITEIKFVDRIDDSVFAKP